MQEKDRRTKNRELLNKLGRRNQRWIKCLLHQNAIYLYVYCISSQGMPNNSKHPLKAISRG
jgi:hypothetical protein